MITDKITIQKGDITQLEVDAIVNAANSTLLGGSGVDGAIHRAAGLELYRECKSLGGCETGDAKITKGYKLPAKHIIHTVGPVWRDGTNFENEKLESCYKRSLEVAVENKIRTIAFPGISTGIYHFPISEACQIAINTFNIFLHDHDHEIDMIYLICYNDELFFSFFIDYLFPNIITPLEFTFITMPFFRIIR